MREGAGKLVLLSRVLLWAPRAQSHWGALGGDLEHTAAWFHLAFNSLTCHWRRAALRNIISPALPTAQLSEASSACLGTRSDRQESRIVLIAKSLSCLPPPVNEIEHRLWSQPAHVQISASPLNVEPWFNLSGPQFPSLSIIPT